MKIQPIFTYRGPWFTSRGKNRGNTRGGRSLTVKDNQTISSEDRGLQEDSDAHIRPNFFFFFVFLGIALITGVCLSLFFAHRASSQKTVYLTEIKQLQEENQAQKFHIQQFSDKVGRLTNQVEKLQNYFARLKILTQLDLREHSDSAQAAGGSRPREFEMDMYLEKNLKRQIRRIHWELEELQMEAQIQEENAHRIENFFDSQQSLLAATPTIWPVTGWVTSRFGHRISPFTGRLQMHEGLDIGSRMGTPVRASADGIVVFASWKNEYGKMVVLDHGYGFRTRYGHLASILVRNGDRIKRGDHIGAVGNTGRSTGPHLHYEVRLKSLPVNPKRYILE